MHNRRNFLKLSAITSAFLGMKSTFSYARDTVEENVASINQLRPRQGDSVIGLNTDPIKQVRVGLIGLGKRGPTHLAYVASLFPKASVVAICDVRKDRIDYALNLLKKQTNQPDIYTEKQGAWKKMVERDDIDLIIIATPWNDHIPMCLYSMQKGKHVAVEVPAAFTLEQCWQLVDTAESTQRHCMMMENVCYGDEELWILNMVAQGVFGTLTYAEAAYIHDLRDSLFSQNKYYHQWRIRHHQSKDGNLYPTHGLGPVARYLNIDRGDRFDHLVSMSTLQAGLTEHSKTVEKDNEFFNSADFVHGDMNNTLIKTDNSKVIRVQHDVVTPRPYSRINALAGTKAYHEGFPSRLSIKGRNSHAWLNEADYQEMRIKYQHPLWKQYHDKIGNSRGHGGMDFLLIYRLIDCLNRGAPLDMDVYDAVGLSVVVPLSKLSIELGSAPIKFPDFTRGNWKEQRPAGIMAGV